jgi:drug/metabolite transporter (DMT)-like permease
MNEMHRDNTPKGYILMTISAFFFSGMGVIVRFTSNLPLFERVFFRNLVMLVIVSILISRSKVSFIGARKSRRDLVLRSLLGFAGVCLYFFTLSRIPLADAVTLNKLSPFFVVVAAAIFLKERINIYQIAALVVVFSGVLLIVKPGFNPELIPALAGLGSAIFAGLAYTTIRHLGKSEHPFTIIFYFCSISTILALPLMLTDFEFMGLKDLLLLVGIGFFASGGQLFMTLSYKYGEAGKVSILGYFTVIFSILFGFMFFGEVPDLLTGIGISMIVLTAVFLYVKARRSSE